MNEPDGTKSLELRLHPSDRLEELAREIFEREAAERRKWLRFKEAARYLGISFRSFERLKDRFGLPVFEKGPAKLVAIADLDALVRSGLVKSSRAPAIPFPSIARPPELALEGAA